MTSMILRKRMMKRKMRRKHKTWQRRKRVQPTTSEILGYKIPTKLLKVWKVIPETLKIVYKTKVVSGHFL